MPAEPVYFDYAATTPVDRRVAELAMHYMTTEFGNAGSRTHTHGAAAKSAVERAREQIAVSAECDPGDVIFTSGATESNNIALLGLTEYARALGRSHIVTSSVEHKAVLEPVAELQRRGVEVTVVPPAATGAIDHEEILARIRPETFLVSLMQVNNETGVKQPLDQVARALPDDVLLHSDAAQGFGKERLVESARVDLMSVSGHKLFAPKGVGALIVRKRNRKRPALTPVMFGGGQERGVRPGTLPVHLISALGLAAELALLELEPRKARCLEIRKQVLDASLRIGAVINGDPALQVPHILNLSVPGVDSEAAILALKNSISISNGSACTSSSYTPSHVLTAMGLSSERITTALRLSWSHETPDLSADFLERPLRNLLPPSGKLR